MPPKDEFFPHRADIQDKPAASKEAATDTHGYQASDRASDERKHHLEETIQEQTQLQKKTLENSKMADNEAERYAFMREAQNAEKKARSAKPELEMMDDAVEDDDKAFL